MDRLKKSDAFRNLSNKIEACHICQLHNSGITPIFGEGSYEAKLMFIGEAPGFWENKYKKPFVGKSGKVLDEYLEKIGLSRKEVFITNIVKCRPPNNRDPTTYEINSCSPYLKEQLDLIKPELIVTLGRFAARFFLDHFTSMNSIVGQLFDYNSFKILPLFHPATCLYQPLKYKPIFNKHFETLKTILDELNI
ncbi:MAG: uracil-DNA glycosylase [Candidatus Hodarchaeales archaeon]